MEHIYLRISKPTITDHIIQRIKMAVFIRWYHTVNKSPLDKDIKYKEWEQQLKTVPTRKNKSWTYRIPNSNQNLSDADVRDNSKWITFIFSEKYIRNITNLFKNTNIKTAYKHQSNEKHTIKHNR